MVARESRSSYFILVTNTYEATFSPCDNEMQCNVMQHARVKRELLLVICPNSHAGLFCFDGRLYVSSYEGFYFIIQLFDHY